MSWGIVASVGVGLLTSKKGGSSSSSKQEMDPRTAQYVFGDDKNQGLLPQVQQQLLQSRSPERMQGWNSMMNRGQSLMGGSVAGNPFSAGYKGGSLFPSQGGNGLGQYTPQPLPMVAPQQQQQQGPTMEEIMAEIERRRLAEMQQQSMQNQGGPGNNSGGSPGDGGVGGGW